MARNGSGAYSLPAGNPVVTGAVISSTTHNTTMSDIATALTASIAKDGQTIPSANLPMGGYKHTGVAVAAARDQYATAGQVQDGTLTVLGSVSGADTITATAPVSMSAYAAGQKYSFTAAGANTGAVTLNLNSIGAKAVTRNGATALVAGDIPSGAVAVVEYDGTQFQLINPASVQDALLKSLAGQTVAAAKIQSYSAADTASLLDFKDEDDMASNSATAVPSQQSVKAYVDSQVGLTTTAVVATTSGTTKDITLPAGSKYGIIPLLGVRMDDSAAPIIQLGDAGGIETTGYTGATANDVPTINSIGWSSGALLTGDPVAATVALVGHVILTLADPATNTWAISVSLSANLSGGVGDGYKGAGQKSLSAELTTIRFTSVAGTATFDLGSIGEGIFF